MRRALLALLLLPLAAPAAGAYTCEDALDQDPYAYARQCEDERAAPNDERHARWWYVYAATTGEGLPFPLSGAVPFRYVYVRAELASEDRCDPVAGCYEANGVMVTSMSSTGVAAVDGADARAGTHRPDARVGCYAHVQGTRVSLPCQATPPALP